MIPFERIRRTRAGTISTTTLAQSTTRALRSLERVVIFLRVAGGPG